MTEFSGDSQFQQAVRDILDLFVDQLDELDVGTFEVGSSPGSVTVEYEDGTVLMLSQQTPRHEIWLSASYRAWHFLRKEGNWVERDTGESMGALLSSLLSTKLGESVALEL